MIEKREAKPPVDSARLDESWSGGTFERAGSLIHYWVAGRQDAPVVMCIHGVTLDHGTYNGQFAALLDAGYRVITLDLRGHGASQPMGSSFAIWLVAEDLIALMDDAGVDRAVLVGQSFGGSVAQAVYRLQPQRVAALALVGTPALGDAIPWHQRLFSRSRPSLLRLWPEQHLRGVIPTFMSKRGEVQQYVAQAIKPLSKELFVSVTEAAIDALLDQERLQTVTVPVLLVHGEEEMGWLARLIRAWAERDERVRCEAVSEAGHLANQDNPAEFNRVLLDFLHQYAPPHVSARG